MPTTIKLKNSVTTTNAPSSLAQGEVAINVTDKKVWVGNAATTPVQLLGTGADGNFSALTCTTLSATGVASFADGTVSLPSITNIGDTNTGIFFPAADTIAFTEGGTESMRIDSSGNVGIGTASPSVRLHANVESSSEVDVARFQASNGADVQFLDIGADATNNLVSFDVTGSSSGSYVFRSGGSERMRIDSSGNVGIGTSSPATKLDVSGNALLSGASGYKYLYFNSVVESSSLRFAKIGKNYDSTFDLGIWASTHTAGNSAATVFYRDLTTESMRIDSSGNLLVGSTSANGKLYVENSSVTNTAKFSDTNASTTSDGICIALAARNTTNNTFYALGYYNTGVGAYKFRVADSGNVTNTNNSYGAISDVKLKENIVDASPKLEDLCKVKIRQYNLKSDPDHKQIGVVAQELEEVFAGLVETTIDKDLEGNDLGTTTKQVKYSVFVPMLIKAIQEQQSIITDLKSRIEALENK
jgi:hypothetical protein